MTTKTRKKLIEVALPLEAINVASAREKSVRNGHPSTLHIWWARRPLAAARAVIFAQMVDDPSSFPDLFPTEKKQEKERERLFKIIEDLVKWRNTTNDSVLQKAREEIWTSWRRACAENADHPKAKELFDRNVLPAFHDPFAGGGALPLEAQRLGLQSYASDLNPVAVLINKAMIEIPSKFAGKPPVNPNARNEAKHGELRPWKGAQGLAEDVRYYGQWMRDEAEKRIGSFYPKVVVTAEMAKERPDLKPYVGQELTVIAWLWARTVKSPNPAFAHVDVPLASTFMLSTKSNKEAYVEPIIDGGSYRFTVKLGKPKNSESAKRGSKSGGSHSAFLCLMSGTPMPFEYLRAESKAGRMGARLMAIVAEGTRGRVYLNPTPEHEAAAIKAKPEWKPDVEISHWPGRTNVVEYGLTNFGDLFTPRQLVALTNFSDLVGEAIKEVYRDALNAGLPDDLKPLRDGGRGANAYAEAIAVYLGVTSSKASRFTTTQSVWRADEGKLSRAFGRQAIPMTWDFAETNPLSETGGDFGGLVNGTADALDRFEPNYQGTAIQSDASNQIITVNKVVSTDPPYYDNIGYADLSDYFYVWLRPSIKSIYPDIFSTVAVPKAEELVASPYRHGSKEKAERFFLDGMSLAMNQLANQAHPAFPISIYYAFKQSETRDDEGTTNTGWDTFLAAVIDSGLSISGTWPIRTEGATRVNSGGANALASSIVLVCRKREAVAPTATRREFVAALKAELPDALRHLQEGNIAPVDLAQAAIGPGMAVYTRYAQVLDAEGKPVPVREALKLINEVLDETLAEQEGDFDADSRWAITWFEQNGFAEGDAGTAILLTTAKGTALNKLEETGIVQSGRGKVRLFKSSELPANWDPVSDPHLTHWEIVHHLIRALESGGESGAAVLAAKLGSKAETARELAYRLYMICERKKRAAEALSYNALVQSWPEILRLAQEAGQSTAAEPNLFSSMER